MTEQNDTRLLPEFLTNEEGSTAFVLARDAPTPEDGVRLFHKYDYEDVEAGDLTRVLMRELDPIGCKIRGVDPGWWVECTTRARNPQPFWKWSA